MSNEVYIHVGIEKTGSTFLQSLIDTNKRLLRKKGIHWVKSGVESRHHYWVAKALNFKYKPGHICEQSERRALRDLNREIDRHSKTRLLLSSEHFDFNLNADNASSLLSLFENRKVIVILFLRNQLDYCQSLYTEHLKWGGVEDFHTFIRRTMKQQRYNFERRYKVWSSVGAEVRVLDFDEAKSDLAKAFFDVLGEPRMVEDLKLPSEPENVTPSIDLMEFVRLTNAGIPPNARRQNYEHIVRRVSRDLPDLLKKRSFPFPPESKSDFIQAFSYNQKLADLLAVNSSYFLRGGVENNWERFSLCRGPDINPILSYYFK